MNRLTNTTMKQKIGWGLILLSGVPWVLIFAIPWLPVPYPVVSAGALYGLSQVMWLVGLWCVGRETLRNIKNWLLTHPRAQAIRMHFGKGRYGHSSRHNETD